MIGHSAPATSAVERDLTIVPHVPGSLASYGFTSTSPALVNAPQVFAIHAITTSTPLSNAALLEHLRRTSTRQDDQPVPSYVEPDSTSTAYDNESLISYSDSTDSQDQLVSPPATPPRTIPLPDVPDIVVDSRHHQQSSNPRPLVRTTFVSPSGPGLTAGAFSNLQGVPNPFLNTTTFSIASGSTSIPNPNSGPPPLSPLPNHVQPLVAYPSSTLSDSLVSTQGNSPLEGRLGTLVPAAGREYTRGRTMTVRRQSYFTEFALMLHSARGSARGRPETEADTRGASPHARSTLHGRRRAPSGQHSTGPRSLSTPTTPAAPPTLRRTSTAHSAVL